MVNWIQESPLNRIHKWEDILQHLDLGIHYTGDAVTTALRLEGQGRYISRGRPPLTAATRTKRREFAWEYLGWKKEDWEKILWCDETWVTGGIHRRVWITCREGERMDESCITESLRKKQGWMFWGCFAGGKKGPGIFWEISWGTMNAQLYQEHIGPAVDAWMQENASSSWTFMQDNAPCHKARSTIADLERRGI